MWAYAGERPVYIAVPDDRGYESGVYANLGEAAGSEFHRQMGILVDGMFANEATVSYVTTYRTLGLV